MFIKPETSLITVGDIMDVYHKIRQKGLGKLFSWMGSEQKRVAQKWDSYVSTSDFWVIPEIQASWNQKISGDANKSYESYVVENYLSDRSGLRLLSIGCGDGLHERLFARSGHFSEVIGVDLAEQRIVRARELARNEQLDITYHAADFRSLNFEMSSFDVILFSSSLHHFQHIDALLREEIKPLLRQNGYLVVFEYCGPNRLQWKNHQLKAANQLLLDIPEHYRLLYDGKTIKRYVYRPGLLRMYLVDPSEAPDSAQLVAALHNNFSVVEETPLGWNLLHLTLKGIAHNFLKKDEVTQSLLAELLQREDDYVAETGMSDAVFGVYQNL